MVFCRVWVRAMAIVCADGNTAGCDGRRSFWLSVTSVALALVPVPVPVSAVGVGSFAAVRAYVA